MIAKPLLPQQTATAKGDAPSRDLVEVIQRIVADILTSENSVSSVSTRVGTLEAIETSNAAAAPGTAPRFFCRAWVNFNGTGTVAIRASGNVSSITDNGVGDYTINFTTAMPDANYSVVISAGDGASPASNVKVGWPVTYSAGSVRIGIADNNADVLFDCANINVAIFR